MQIQQAAFDPLAELMRNLGQEQALYGGGPAALGYQQAPQGVVVGGPQLEQVDGRNARNVTSSISAADRIPTPTAAPRPQAFAAAPATQAAPRQSSNSQMAGAEAPAAQTHAAAAPTLSAEPTTAAENGITDAFGGGDFRNFLGDMLAGTAASQGANGALDGIARGFTGAQQARQAREDRKSAQLLAADERRIKAEDRAYSREQDVLKNAREDRHLAADEAKAARKGAGYQMLTDPADRARYGIQDDDTRPYQISPEGQLSVVGGTGQSENPGVEARNREALAERYGIDPKSAEGQRFILTGSLPSSDKGVTAGDRQAIREADDAVMSGESTLSLLSQAEKENGNAMEGVTAGTRAMVGNNLPDGIVPDFIASPEDARATSNYDNLVTTQALGQLKTIFGGNPTEGERAILLDIQGSSSQPIEVRKQILQRARDAVERRIAFNRDRANELRGGTYYEPQGQGGAPAAPAADARQSAPRQTTPAQPKSDEEYNALPSGTLFVDPDDGQTYRKP